MWQFLHFYFNKTPNSPAAYNLFYFHRKIFGQNIRCPPDQAPVDAEHEKWGGKGQMWYVSLDLTRTNISSYTYIFTLFTYTIQILYIFTGKYQSRSHFRVTSCSANFSQLHFSVTKNWIKKKFFFIYVVYLIVSGLPCMVTYCVKHICLWVANNCIFEWPHWKTFVV